MEFKINAMKNIFVIILIALTFTCLEGQSQIQKDELSKKTQKWGFDSKYSIEYSNEENSTYENLRPKDKENNVAELNDIKLNSIEKLEQITSQIFTKEQAEYLAKNKCYFSCLVSSSGKIITASISFSNHDPEVDRKQLLEFLKQIKENLSFDLSFDREIEQMGYVILVRPAFPSLMNPKSIKSKP
jgi:hypothetical protein